MSPGAAPEAVRIPAARLEQFCRRVLAAAGVRAADAETIADALVAADLRGTQSHGVNLLARYTRGFLGGGLNPAPACTIVREHGATAVMDGDNGLGHVVGVDAMRLALARARRHGVGVVAARNSNHFGAAAYFAMMAPPHGMIGFATTNGPAVMAPWGGRTATLCNNPISYAIPTWAGEPPIVLDMATSVVARGRVRLAAQRGERIPRGWAVGPDGDDTEDGADAIRGALLPVGGPKGSGLALVSEALAGVLPAATLTVDVARSVHLDGRAYQSQRIGHLMMAIDIAAFVPLDEFEDRMRHLVAGIRATPAASGVERILLPGEPELTRRADNLVHGIPLASPTLAQLDDLAADLGVPALLDRRGDSAEGGQV
jgi:LDH2 family malate/lactate/ureidoglycolate dehydrogenase